MTQRKTVLLVEPEGVLRESMTAVIASIPEFQIVGQPMDVEEAFVQLAVKRPEIVILSADMGKKGVKSLKNIIGQMSAVIVLCTEESWTEETVAQVMNAGASGCLTKHFTASEFLKTVVAAEEGSGGRKGKIITLFSPHSGCGKTTLATNLAFGLAQLTKTRVGIIDGNLSFGDLALFFNVYPTSTIIEAARDLQYLSQATFGAYLTNCSETIKLLASPSKPEKAELIHGDDMAQLLAVMQRSFSYVIVDTEPGFNEVALAACDAADTVYIVAAFNSSVGIEHMSSALDTFRSLGYSENKLKVVFSRVSRDIDNLDDLEHQIDYPVTALLPNDFRLIADAINKGVPLLSNHPDSALAKGIMDVVRDVIGAEVLIS